MWPSLQINEREIKENIFTKEMGKRLSILWNSKEPFDWRANLNIYEKSQKIRIGVIWEVQRGTKEGFEENTYKTIFWWARRCIL